MARLRPSPVLARISSRSQTQARKVARELLKRADTIVKHAQTGTTPLELARVCKASARVPAGIANARARSVAAPIANRELQKSTGGGRKCSQLFPVEHEGGGAPESSAPLIQDISFDPSKLRRLRRRRKAGRALCERGGVGMM